MKKLGKRNAVSQNTVQAYALGCGCTCKCYCIKIWKFNFYANSYASTYSDIAMTPKLR